MQDSPRPLVSVRRTLAFLLHDTARMMRRRFVQLARKDGLPLSRSEASVLLHIAHEPGLNQATLAAQLDIEPIAVVRLLDSLQGAGLVERRPHPTDRRARTIWLTAAADPVLARIRTVIQAVRRDALVGVPPEKLEELLDLLVKIRGNLAALPEEE